MSVSQEHLRAYQRRVWRLAYLLTGNAPGAAALVDRVFRAQPDLMNLEPARLDRLVIQHARDLPVAAPLAAGQLPEPPPGVRRTLDAILKLPEQPREAWVLARVDELDELHVSRAMDCSKTASMHHLAAADTQMAAALGDTAAAAIRSLRGFADALNPDPIIRAHRELARRIRFRRAALTGGALLVLVLVFALALLQGWFV
jgi:DNA-directed RNA polymerase specialized sigma24 family protein